jgi:hypothetical protein
MQIYRDSVLDRDCGGASHVSGVCMHAYIIKSVYVCSCVSVAFSYGYEGLKNMSKWAHFHAFCVYIAMYEPVCAMHEPLLSPLCGLKERLQSTTHVHVVLLCIKCGFLWVASISQSMDA